MFDDRTHKVALLILMGLYVPMNRNTSFRFIQIRHTEAITLELVP